MPRPVWSGTISFGLVSIPVKLFHAVSRKACRSTNSTTARWSRIKLQEGVGATTARRCPTSTSSRATSCRKDHTSSSTRTSSSRSIPAATHTIDIEEFVDLDEIDPVYFDAAYYVAPGQGAQAVRAARQAMEESRQGRHRPLRDAQQAVPRRRSAPSDGRLVLSTMVVRRRGDRPGANRRARRASTRSSVVRPRGADGRVARRVAVGRRSSPRSTATSTASRCST